MSRFVHAQGLYVRLDSRSGAQVRGADETVTFISLSIILTSVMLEFIDYRRIHLEPSIIVDRSRGEKLVIEMDVTFPRVPCYRKLSPLFEAGCVADAAVLSLDVMDISGEHQSDLEHDIVKTRLSKDGAELETLKDGSKLILTRECTRERRADVIRTSRRGRTSQPEPSTGILRIMLWSLTTREWML